MAEILTNIEISKVYKGKSGESEYGPWQAYNFYVKGYDHKFGYFQKKGGIVPVQGMKILVLEYEINQRGEYTNYDVKRIELLKDTSQLGQKPPQAASEPRGSTQRDSSLTMYISYAKDLMVALMSVSNFGAFPTHFQDYSFEDMCNDVVKRGMAMQDMAMESVCESKPEPNTGPIKIPETPDNSQAPPPPGDNDIPY